MSNELGIPALPTGLTLLGKVYAADATQEGSNVSMTEGASGVYKGDFSLAAVADGEYMISYETATKKYGYGFLFVRNNASVSQYEFEKKSEADTRQTALITEIDANETKIDALETKAQADTRQSTLVSEHDATQTDIANLNDLSVDDVWDEVIDNVNHNTAKSAGKRLRQAGTSLAVEGTVDDVSPTTGSFVSDLTQTNSSFYADQTCIFVDGDLEGQARVITSYDSGTKVLTFDEPWTVAPANGDEFEIKADHIHPVSQIQDGLATQASVDLIETKAQADARQATLVADIDATETKAEADIRQAILEADISALDVKLTDVQLKQLTKEFYKLVEGYEDS